VIKELKGEQKELDAKFKSVFAECDKQRKGVLEPDKVAELQKIVHGAEAYAQAREALGEAERKLADFRGQYKDSTSLKNTKSVALGELEDAVASIQTEVDYAKSVIASADVVARAAEQKSHIEVRMKEALSFLEKPAPENPSDVDFSELEEKKERLAADRHTLLQWTQFLNTFQGSGSTTCPTCFQRVNADVINRIHDETNNLGPKVEECERVVGLEEAERRHMQDAHDGYVRGCEEAKRTVEACKKDLEALGEAKAPDDANLQEMKELVAVYTQTMTKATCLKQEVAVQEERHRNMFNAMTNAGMEVDRLRSKLAAEPKADEVQKARDKLAAHENARTSVARMEGELTQVSERQKQVSTMLNQRIAEEEKLEGLKTYRNLCERTRTLLHRDNLPNLVGQAYMKSLNTHLEHYLEVFDVPFRARMMEDTSILCQFGEREIPAGRLSGGQRVALGLTWRFAVHALFVNHLGLMILDEPTVFLDKDRIDSVYTLLERVKSYSKAADLQVLVSTHEERLAGALDQVITL
jgi:exonuclease SbcC